VPDDKIEEIRFEGVTVRIGNHDWVMPSLSVKQAKKFWPEILEMDNLDRNLKGGDIPVKVFDAAIPIIHAALSRNYPSLTVEQVEDMVSLSQLKQLLLIVSGQSGFKAGEKGPDAAKDQATVH